MVSARNRPAILALTSDVFLIPRLEDVAGQVGFRMETAEGSLLAAAPDSAERKIPLTEPLEGRTAELVRRLAADPPALIVVDLASGEIPWRPWIQALKTSSATRRVPIVAFGPHVETEPLEEARRLGADRVVTRGQFHRELAEILRSEARPPDLSAIQEGCARTMSAEARAGWMALSAGAYFKAHEHLERAVLEEPGTEGAVYRCLLHLAVACLHTERGNWRGAQKMLLRMRPWLAPLPETCRGFVVGEIRDSLDGLQRQLDQWRERGEPPSALIPPRIPETPSSSSANTARTKPQDRES